MKKEGKNNKLDKNFLLDNYSTTRISIFTQTIVYTITIIGIFGGLGYYLDQKFDSSPKILIIAIAISWPITQFILYKKFKQYAKNKIEKSSKNKQPK